MIKILSAEEPIQLSPYELVCDRTHPLCDWASLSLLQLIPRTLELWTWAV